jgi:hypothetical protein
MVARASLLFASVAATLGFATAASAQDRYMCRDTRIVPRGTYAACGNAPGYYRPQPYTLRDGRVVRTPNSWYAPSGPRQRYWNQYDAESRTYGPREPNPFNERGRLSIPRTTRHLYETRIRPRFRRGR